MATDYKPKPIQTEHIVLGDEFLELVELLAENAHDIWASERLQDGWTFGPERDDTERRHPCLVPYAQLPDRERDYDRTMVIGSIRAILALGFTISRARPGVEPAL
jgi:RyR domain